MTRPIATKADGRPAYEHFKGRTRQSHVNYERSIRQRYAELVADAREPVDLPESVSFLNDQQTGWMLGLAATAGALAVGAAFFVFLP
ncbi:hypothetical protein [Novosphingobium mathurense]|uniref:Uncharacterized protein n=1 Tax=Novosphingobium mathurense TaxID=428990 RepID=A0A1U6I7K3_9SPHN|nr:hypothetical protein [Novosphingobium mathurense]SLK03983.1 hypothetical protein SAMN06295987_104319 [Novosphingobium mathurense]